MLRSLTTLAVFTFTFPACSNVTADELAGETAADDAAGGKADATAVDGAYTYFAVTPDLRKCLSPVCGGYFAARVNRSTTTCSNGHVAGSCYVAELDWSESNLPDALSQKLIDAAGKDASSGGVYAIARGRIAAQTYGNFGNLGRLVVTEAWVAESDSGSDGVFVKVKDNGIRCITVPCPSLTEKGLNTSRSANLAEIEWAPAGFTDREIEGFTSSLYAGGVILAGDRYTVPPHAKGRTATQAYHRLAP